MTGSSRPGRDTALRQLLRPLRPFLDDRAVTEIAVNRPQELWTKDGPGWQRHEVLELTLDYLQALSTAIAVYNGLPVTSLLSAALPDGERCQIVREPASVPGWTPTTIRKHAPASLTLDQLERTGSFEGVRDVSFHRPSASEATDLMAATGVERLEDPEVELLSLKREGRLADFCRRAVHHRRNIVIAGKTDSGKTTLARALVAEVPVTERSSPSRTFTSWNSRVTRTGSTSCSERARGG